MKLTTHMEQITVNAPITFTDKCIPVDNVNFDNKEIIVELNGRRIVYELEGVLQAKEVDIEKGVRDIPVKQFKGSKLQKINLPAVENIGEEAFANSLLENVEGCENLKTIGKCAFQNCGNLKNFPSSSCCHLETIEEDAFAECDFEKFVILQSVKYIGESAFYRNRNLKSVQLSEGLEEIGNCAFSRCNLSTIELPNSLKKIGIGVFNNNGNLTEIHGPSKFQKQLEQEYPNIKYIVNDKKDQES